MIAVEQSLLDTLTSVEIQYSEGRDAGAGAQRNCDPINNRVTYRLIDRKARRSAAREPLSVLAMRQEKARGRSPGDLDSATCPASPRRMAGGSERHRGDPAAVTLTDGMTAGFYRFEMSSLWTTAARISNEVKGCEPVAYDVTSKPKIMTQ
ncbi:hypothetical protein ACF1BQ_017410 [Bradyrhizobium sp. RDT10]